jgi:FMN-dependent NADH-azoreductase
MTLLRLDSSPRQRSVTRPLAGHVVDIRRRDHPLGAVIERDLAATPMPPITDQWMRRTPIRHRWQSATARTWRHRISSSPNSSPRP